MPSFSLATAGGLACLWRGVEEEAVHFVLCLPSPSCAVGVRGWGFSCVWLPHPLVCVLCVLLVSWLAHANWLHQALPSVPLHSWQLFLCNPAASGPALCAPLCPFTAGRSLTLHGPLMPTPAALAVSLCPQPADYGLSWVAMLAWPCLAVASQASPCP